MVVFDLIIILLIFISDGCLVSLVDFPLKRFIILELLLPVVDSFVDWVEIDVQANLVLLENVLVENSVLLIFLLPSCIPLSHRHLLLSILIDHVKPQASAPTALVIGIFEINWLLHVVRLNLTSVSYFIHPNGIFNLHLGARQLASFTVLRISKAITIRHEVNLACVGRWLLSCFTLLVIEDNLMIKPLCCHERKIIFSKMYL